MKGRGVRREEGEERGGGRVATSMDGCSWGPGLQTSQVAKRQKKEAAQELLPRLLCH